MSERPTPSHGTGAPLEERAIDVVTSWQLAEFNIARLHQPLEHPDTAPFVDALDMVNALAESSPGFVWRLQDESGQSSSYVRAYDDPLMIINLSVWESPDALRDFVFRTSHTDFLRRRREWFERMEEAWLVCWWVAAGTVPTVDEAVERLDRLHRDGPTAEAFTLRDVFRHPSLPPPDLRSHSAPGAVRESSPDRRQDRLGGRLRGVGAHRLSLAAGTVPECSPPDTVSAAAAAGFDASGVWVDLATWTPVVAADVRTRLADTGLRALDAEVIRLAADRSLDDPKRVVDIAAAVGAEFVLTISLDPDLARTAAQFAELCAHADTVGVRPVLEFMRFTTVRTLADAVGVVQAAGHPAGGVLVDALHLDRAGGSPADVAALDPALLPYAQLCDAPAARPPQHGLVAEALDGRLLPGDGALPLDDLMSALPRSTPFSMELRSAALRTGYPDAVERAQVVLAASRAMVDGAR